MKRGYFVYPDDELWGIGVVARTAKEAKNIAFASGKLIDVDWIDLRVRWERTAKIEKLPIGIVSDMHIGLLCGLYGFVEGYKCDECGAGTVLHLCNDKALCDDCIEKEYLEELKAKVIRNESN
jgi:hypothetical protein